MEEDGFRVSMKGPVSIVEVRGPLDEAVAADLLEVIAAAAAASPVVQIDLDGVVSITQEAAAMLLFRDAHWRALSDRITLRASGPPGRQAVLRAYARRRARSQMA